MRFAKTDEITERVSEYFGNETCRLTPTERVTVAAAVIGRLGDLIENDAMEIDRATEVRTERPR